MLTNNSHWLCNLGFLIKNLFQAFCLFYGIPLLELWLPEVKHINASAKYRITTAHHLVQHQVLLLPLIFTAWQPGGLGADRLANAGWKTQTRSTFLFFLFFSFLSEAQNSILHVMVLKIPFQIFSLHDIQRRKACHFCNGSTQLSGSCGVLMYCLDST